MPGSRDSSSTTLVTGRAVMAMVTVSAGSNATCAGKRVPSRKPGQSHSGQAAGGSAQLLLRQLQRPTLSVVQGGHDGVLQRLDVFRIDELRVDLNALHLLMAVHHDHNGAAAG